MTGDANFRNRCNLSACYWINDPKRLISVVGDQEQVTTDFAVWLCGIQGRIFVADVERQKEEHHRQVCAEHFCNPKYVTGFWSRKASRSKQFWLHG